METTTSYSTDDPIIILALILGVLFVVFMVTLMPVVIIAAVTRRKAERFMNQRTGTIITQFDPPLDLSPAEIGLLYDTVCNHKEVRATLFDLTQKNIIRFNSTNKVSVINQSAYQKLPEYAKIAVRMFDDQTAKNDKQFSDFTITSYIDGEPKVTTLKIPQKQTTTLFTESVRQSLKNKGYEIKKFRPAFWRRVIFFYIVLWAIPWLLTILFGGVVNNEIVKSFSLDSVIQGAASSFAAGIFLAPLYLLISFIMVKIFIKIAGKYWVNTKQVRKLWPTLEGYRRFLKTVDLSRLQYESTNSPLDTVTDTLPYAMVFNLDTKWEERLKAIKNQNKITPGI